MLVVQLARRAGRGAPWPGSTRPRSTRTFASPPTTASAGIVSCGSWLPSTSTMLRLQRAGPRPRAASPAASACRMLSASISSTLASATLKQHSALRGSRVEPLALLGGQQLGVGRGRGSAAARRGSRRPRPPGRPAGRGRPRRRRPSGRRRRRCRAAWQRAEGLACMASQRRALLRWHRWRSAPVSRRSAWCMPVEADAQRARRPAGRRATRSAAAASLAGVASPCSSSGTTNRAAGCWAAPTQGW